MTADMPTTQPLTPGAQLPVTCPACRRRPSLLVGTDGDVLARGRCVCGHTLALVETAGEDGLPVRYVVTDTRRTGPAARTRRLGRRAYSEADPL